MHEKNPVLPINNQLNSRLADGIEINLYTDPLCCWSWAMRPPLNTFLGSFRQPVQVNYKMVGLVPSWSQYIDRINSIAKPIQMGPEWMHARAISGVPIDNSIWIKDPPSSSFPACIAVKAAGLQSAKAEETYFYLLQNAVMTEARNIAKTTILLQIAIELQKKDTSFDVSRFETDLYGTQAREKFRQDLTEAKYLNINRLPAIVLKRRGKGSKIISGYQTSAQLLEALDLLMA